VQPDQHEGYDHPAVSAILTLAVDRISAAEERYARHRAECDRKSNQGRVGEEGSWPAPVEDGEPEIGPWAPPGGWTSAASSPAALLSASLLPSEIVRIKPVQVEKFDGVVVARRVQHHAVRRRARLFVADIGSLTRRL
jgi:hypothetical protein